MKYFLLLLLANFIAIVQLTTVSYAQTSNARIEYSGVYESHYTATLPFITNKQIADNQSCQLDQNQGIVLYQYRYFTKIPMPSRKRGSNFLSKEFWFKYTEKTVKIDLAKHYKTSETSAWQRIKQSYFDKYGIEYDKLKNCISFEKLVFKPVVLKKTFEY